MSCDVGKATEELENELWRRWSVGKVGQWAAHSPTFSSLYLHRSSFSNPSVALPTSQLILQPFLCFSYITAHSPNPSFASPTSQALHLGLRYMTSRTCYYRSLENFLSFFLLHIFIHLQSRTYNPNSRGSDACRGSNFLWNRTLDRYTRAGLPECVVSTMSGPPPETPWDRTQKTQPKPRIGMKSSRT